MARINFVHIINIGEIATNAMLYWCEIYSCLHCRNEVNISTYFMEQFKTKNYKLARPALPQPSFNYINKQKRISYVGQICYFTNIMLS